MRHQTTIRVLDCVHRRKYGLFNKAHSTRTNSDTIGERKSSQQLIVMKEPSHNDGLTMKSITHTNISRCIYEAYYYKLRSNRHMIPYADTM